MTRLDPGNVGDSSLNQMQAEISRLKKDLKHKQSKKIFNCGTCLLIILFLLLVLLGFGSYVLAKSGLRQVPVFTAYFYHEPKPLYLVTAQKADENSIIKRLASLVSNEALKQKKTDNIAVDFDLSEAELTGLLNNQLVKNDQFKSDIEFWQIAVKSDLVEFFMKSKNPKNVIITLHAKPEVDDGKLKFKVIDFKLGDLRLPGFIGSILIENLGTNALNSLLNSVSLLGQIQEINLAQGKVIIKLLIKNLINFKDAI